MENSGPVISQASIMKQNHNNVQTVMIPPFLSGPSVFIQMFLHKNFGEDY